VVTKFKANGTAEQKKGKLDAKSCKRRAAWKIDLKWKNENNKNYSNYFNEKIKKNNKIYSRNVSKLAGRYSILCFI
jgi:hypothetical protein